MAARSYLPTLRLILHRATVYTNTYQALMQPYLTPAQRTALAEFIVCLATLVAELGPEPIDP